MAQEELSSRDLDTSSMPLWKGEQRLKPLKRARNREKFPKAEAIQHHFKSERVEWLEDKTGQREKHM